MSDTSKKYFHFNLVLNPAHVSYLKSNPVGENWSIINN